MAINHTLTLVFKQSAQRNETETKQFQNSFETVLFQFHFVVRSVLNTGIRLYPAVSGAVYSPVKMHCFSSFSLPPLFSLSPSLVFPVRRLLLLSHTLIAFCYPLTYLLTPVEFCKIYSTDSKIANIFARRLKIQSSNARPAHHQRWCLGGRPFAVVLKAVDDQEMGTGDYTARILGYFWNYLRPIG